MTRQLSLKTLLLLSLALHQALADCGITDSFFCLYRQPTVCEALFNGTHTVQGVILPPESATGLLLVDDQVFVFDAKTDLVPSEGVHRIQLHKKGVHVENYFPGVYLKDGNRIFNAYGLMEEGVATVNFVLTNDGLVDEKVGGRGLVT